MMNVKIDGLKVDIKMDMEGLKEGLTKLLQKIVPSGDKVFHEIHYENKRNVNHDFRDSKLGMNINYITNINMRNFDSKDLVTWILHMEQFFDLHYIPHTQKVHITFLYLEKNLFVWYQWLCSRKPVVSWTIFTE